MPLKKNISGKRRILLVLLALLLILSVGATIAYITLKTPKVTNEFVPAVVTCEVQETFENGVKKDVCVKNTGNVSSYIRVALVINWVNDNDKTVLSTVPVENVDYTLSISDQGWKKGSDGYYYYCEPVKAGYLTSNVITEAKVNESKAPAGYSLSIQVLASAIQSEPTKAVEENWNVTVNNGNITPITPIS